MSLADRAFPDPTDAMDYSSIHENEDLQTGSSPWASSPQHNRNFGRSSTDEPPSPPPTALGPAASDSPDGQRRSGQPQLQDARTSDVQAASSNIPYRDLQQQAAPNGQQRQHPQQQQTDGHQRHLQDPQQTQRQQRPKPNYTMSAKINGMERAGRKDPMFRFDVHVCAYDISRV